ncbi:MAG TPA: phosphatidylglycerophosphatase A [Casimicrobiaceae bacterium]|nr:phosphatidylglycerophosphatase A [Casimicrobiaceae bacterium]
MTRAPSIRFLVAHPAHFIALGFGLGLSPIAPGTVGTLLAVPLAVLLQTYGNELAFLCAVIAAFGVGVWAADRTGRDLGKADHPAIVWDEVVAFLLVLLVVGVEPLRVGIAFLLFRLFDIVKLPPASTIDRQWHHGFGVMADDIVAAFYALIVFAIGQRIVS